MKLALAQMQMSERIEENLKQTLRLIHEAAEQGADLICFPEIQLSPFFPQYTGLDVTGYLLQENDPAVRAVQAACRENRIFASRTSICSMVIGAMTPACSLMPGATSSAARRWSTLPNAPASMSRTTTPLQMRAFRSSTHHSGGSGSSFALTAIIPRASARRHCAVRISS